MRDSIGSREVVTVMVGATRLRGTYHRPLDAGAAPPRTQRSSHGIGILFLNSGFLPRAARGDSAVYWADAFSKAGYPSFRFDLAGLGDSDGDLPRDVLDYVGRVNAGAFAPLVSTVAKDLVGRFGLSGVVVVGVCAGAVSAVYATAGEGNVDIKGLVLLDPYFHLQQKSPIQELSSSSHARIVPQLYRTWCQKRRDLHYWALRSDLGGKLHAVWRRTRALATCNRLPANANLPLVRCWERLVSSGLPMLVFTAPQPGPRSGGFDYLGYLRAVGAGRAHLEVRPIEVTTHDFVQGCGKESVRRDTERWLNDSFPGHAASYALRDSEGHRIRPLLSEAGMSNGVGRSI